MREEVNLSQQQLADILFIDRTLVNKWEHGKITLTLYNLKNICDFFNVTTDEILAGERKNDKKMVTRKQK